MINDWWSTLMNNDKCNPLQKKKKVSQSNSLSLFFLLQIHPPRLKKNCHPN